MLQGCSSSSCRQAGISEWEAGGLLKFQKATWHCIGRIMFLWFINLWLSNGFYFLSDMLYSCSTLDLLESDRTLSEETDCAELSLTLQQAEPLIHMSFNRYISQSIIEVTLLLLWGNTLVSGFANWKPCFTRIQIKKDWSADLVICVIIPKINRLHWSTTETISFPSFW